MKKQNAKSRKIVVIMVFVLSLLFFSPQAYSQSHDGWTINSAPVFEGISRAYYPTVLIENDVYKMWYDDAGGIGYATSTDGIVWSAPVFVIGLTNPAHSVVKKIEGEYRIWYWDYAHLYSVNALRTAKSADGINWTDDQVIQQQGTTVITGSLTDPHDLNRGSYGPGDILYNPSGSGTLIAPVDAVTIWANKYVMYYDGTTGGVQNTFLAVSADGIFWQGFLNGGYENGSAPVLVAGDPGEWDATHLSGRSVIKESDGYYMWYSGGDNSINHGIGQAFSVDGITWTKNTDNPTLHKDDADAEIWRKIRTYTPFVVRDDDNFEYKMWFNGRDGSVVGMNQYVLGLATKPFAYDVVYRGNGHNDGSTPVDQTKIHGIDLTLQTNIGSLSKIGYDFTGWNTATDGAGVHYNEGGNFTIEADTTLYSEWTLGVCSTIPNAATYNVYPTCGVATCNQGYTLKDGQCISSGGDGAYIPPSSSGSGQSDYYIDIFGQRSLGQTTNEGFNVLAYIGSTAIFDATTSKFNTVSQYKVKIVDLDMTNKIITLEISPALQIIKLAPGEEKMINLDNDLISDIFIRYNELLINRVDLTIKQLSFIDQFVTLDIKNGDVVKEYDDTTVYLMQDNQKRPFFNEDAYLGSGYQWSQIREYSDLSAIQMGKMIYAPIPEPESTNAGYQFTRDLSTGMIGDDVKELQKYLNNNGFILAAEGPGSSGNETDFFGVLTQNALIAHQEANNITPAAGYFGPITREAVNSHN